MPETRRELILVGGGHSHVQVLRMLAMRPLPGFSVTVVLDRPVAVYSGMVPGLVAGQYAPHEVEIDVRPLARRAGCRVVMARAVAVDPMGRRVHLEGRPPLPYDLCSLNVGATVAGLDLPGVRQHALPTRPIARFVRQLSASIDRLRPLDRPARVAVVGAGAAGVEVAFCLQQRLAVALARPPQVLLLGPAPARCRARGRAPSGPRRPRGRAGHPDAPG